MNRRMTSILLLSLVALSIISACSCSVSAVQTPDPQDAKASRHASAHEDACHNPKPDRARPMLRPLGDPIDDPKAHK